MNSKAPTVVTAYYTMQSKFSKALYMSWIQLFLRTVNCNLIFFVESEEMRDKLAEFVSWPERVVFRICKKDSWISMKRGISFWEKQLEKMEQEMELHKSFLLGAIWNEKIHFLQKAIEENPFGSNVFIWSDAGIMRTEEIARESFLFGCDENVIYNDKIHILQVGPIDDTKETKEIWYPKTPQEVRFGGGILGGTIRAWKDMIPKYETMIDKLVSQNVCVFKDQIIWANLVRQDSEQFEIYQAYNNWYYLLNRWSSFPSHCTPTFIINLDKRMDRWREIQAKWEFTQDVYRFPAFPHSTYSWWLHAQVVNGCTNSHLSIISLCKGTPCLVLEDDADPDNTSFSDLHQLLRLAVKEVPVWDLLNFGSSTLMGLHQQTFGGVRVLPSPEFYQTRISSTTHCIAYNKTMIDKLSIALRFIQDVKYAGEAKGIIDYLLCSGNMVQCTQIIPSSRILSRQRPSMSDLSNTMTNYNSYFDIVNTQLQAIRQSWIPVAAPIIVELLGGLGNQLFVVAAGMYLANQTGRSFAILRQPKQKNPHSSVNYLETIFKDLPQVDTVSNIPYTYIEENELVEKEIQGITNTDLQKVCILKGYFQKSVYNTQSFRDKVQLPKIDVGKDKKTCIHIRGGDYLQIRLHNVNLQPFRKKVLSYTKQLPIEVYSNDEAYAEKVMKELNVNYIVAASSSELIDFVRLASTPGAFIGSNSSFSWWACAFSKKNRLNFLPHTWYNGDKTPNTKSLFHLANTFVI